LLLHLGQLFRVLGNCYRGHFLRSYMMQTHKCSCLGALQGGHEMMLMNEV
jgi:hypothetical protein